MKFHISRHKFGTVSRNMLSACMAVLTALLLILVLAAHINQKTARQPGEPVRLRLANNLTEESATTQAIQWFSEQVNERTQGRVEIEIFNNGSLGDVQSSLEQLQYGGADIVKGDLMVMGNFIEDFSVLAMPYIYDSTEHFWKVHEGEVGMGLLRGDKIQALGMYGLTYYDGGTRCFYSRDKKIQSPEDLKGMTIRVQESELMVSMLKALEARPLIADYSDVYRILQTGEADGAENSIVNYLFQGYYEVAPYFVEDQHTRSADILVMSTESRKKISPEDLEIIDRTALESWELQKKLWAQAEAQARQALLDKNVTITTLTEEELEEFRLSCEQLWYTYRDGAYIDLIDRIVAAGK